MATALTRLEALLEANPDGVTPRQAAERTGLPVSTTRFVLGHLVALGVARRLSDGRYVRRGPRVEQAPVTVRRLTPEELARVRAGLPSDGIGPRLRKREEAIDVQVPRCETCAHQPVCGLMEHLEDTLGEKTPRLPGKYGQIGVVLETRLKSCPMYMPAVPETGSRNTAA